MSDVHVWRAAWDEVEPPPDCLSADERERAAGFRFARDRERYVRARSALRSLLALYTRRDARGIRLHYNAAGKPYLADGTNLEFSVAHSGVTALFAFCRTARVGIDVENIRSTGDEAEVLAQYGMDGEAGAVLALPAERRLEAFFTWWTRKEAYVKARGERAAGRLHDFQVTLEPEGRILRDAADPHAPERWRLLDVDAGPGVKAALAVESAHVSLRLFDWHG